MHGFLHTAGIFTLRIYLTRNRNGRDCRMDFMSAAGALYIDGFQTARTRRNRFCILGSRFDSHCARNDVNDTAHELFAFWTRR